MFVYDVIFNFTKLIFFNSSGGGHRGSDREPADKSPVVHRWLPPAERHMLA